MNSITPLLACIITTFALSSAAQSTQPVTASPPPRKKQQREALRAELTHLLQENHVACSLDSDCDAVAVGSMACGGPKEFVPTSKATLKKIQTLVTDLTKTIEEMDQARNQEQAQAGICLALVKPEVTCKSGSCQAKK